MILINLLPTALLSWFVGIILFLGIAGTLVSIFIKFIPFPFNTTIELYRLPIQLASVLLLVVGVYFMGGLAVEKEWRGKVAVAELRAEIAEKESKKVNTVIETRTVEKIKYITKKGQTIIKLVPTYITKEIDKKCTLTEADAIAVKKIHDAAALNDLNALTDAGVTK